jgi:hypothetical protein
LGFEAKAVGFEERGEFLVGGSAVINGLVHGFCEDEFDGGEEVSEAAEGLEFAP